jgi:hypothetical protein
MIFDILLRMANYVSIRIEFSALPLRKPMKNSLDIAL